MLESMRLAPRDFDVWHQATPFQLLQLMKRLGIEGRVIARWVGATPAAVSQWSTGKRTISPHYAPALLTWAQTAWEQAIKRNDKEVARQPTEALQRAARAE